MSSSLVGPKGPRKRQVIVMRHGERRDGHPDAVPEDDPPLTATGVEDVARIAERLQEVLGADALKHVQLVSSPFLRTRQTAEALQKNGVGARNDVVIDNTLSEVYGPSRIKIKEPHKFENPEVVKSGSGRIPEWGETLEEAATRYCESFLSNTSRWPKATKGGSMYSIPLLVTHGDAIGAIVRFFYPTRIVYLADYLSFLVLEEVSDSTSLFRITHAEAVEWILDGDDEDPEERVARERRELSFSAGSDEESPNAAAQTKRNEGCEPGCPPNTRSSASQSSVSPNGQAKERPPGCFLLGKNDANLGTVTHLASILVIFLSSIDCDKTFVALHLIAASLVIGCWSMFVLMVANFRIRLPGAMNYLLIGQTRVVEYSAVSDPQDQRSELAAGASPPPRDPSSRRWNHRTKFVLWRAMYLAVFLVFATDAAGIFLSCLAQHGFSILLFYLDQLSHLFSLTACIAFVLLTFLACRYDIHVLLLSQR